jgi:hypothetical protein
MESIEIRITRFHAKGTVVKMCGDVDGNASNFVIPFDHVLRLEEHLSCDKRDEDECQCQQTRRHGEWLHGSLPRGQYCEEMAP